jgi:hypothetical protein
VPRKRRFTFIFQWPVRIERKRAWEGRGTKPAVITFDNSAWVVKQTIGGPPITYFGQPRDIPRKQGITELADLWSGRGYSCLLCGKPLGEGHLHNWEPLIMPNLDETTEYLD